MIGANSLFFLVSIKTGWLRRMKNQIQELRKLQGFSQEELAKRCSVTRQTINAIENDKYDPTLSLAFKLSRNLNAKVDELFIFEEEDR